MLTDDLRSVNPCRWQCMAMSALQSVVETMLSDEQAADYLMTLLTTDLREGAGSTVGVLMRDVLPGFLVGRGGNDDLMFGVVNKQIEEGEPDARQDQVSDIASFRCVIVVAVLVGGTCPDIISQPINH